MKTRPIQLAIVIMTNLFVSSLAVAEVKEAGSLADILPAVDSRTLVIFDLDNTVIEASSALGGDAWFSHNVGQYVAAGLPIQEAKDRAASEWVKVQPFVKVRTVEKGTRRAIEMLQKQGVSVIALTARPGLAFQDTLRQLNDVSISFLPTAISKRDITFTLEREVFFSRGILQVNNTNKGTALLRLLEIVGYTPKNIVFVDDKLHNVDDVNEALNAAGSAPHLEFRYGAADSRVDSYNHSIATMQQQLLGKIVPDDLVLKMLQAGGK